MKKLKTNITFVYVKIRVGRDLKMAIGLNIGEMYNDIGGNDVSVATHIIVLATFGFRHFENNLFGILFGFFNILRILLRREPARNGMRDSGSGIKRWRRQVNWFYRILSKSYVTFHVERCVELKLSDSKRIVVVQPFKWFLKGRDHRANACKHISIHNKFDFRYKFLSRSSVI